MVVLDRLRRARPLTLATVGLAVLVAVVALVRAGRADPVDLSGGGSTVWVGVRDGDQVPAYARASAAELDRLARTDPRRDAYALVSLRDYRAPRAVGELLAAAGGLRLVAAYARVPLPRRQTEVVRLTENAHGDLGPAMDQVARRKLAQAQRYASQAAADPAGADDSAARVAQAEATAYQEHCACVYALVVRGMVDALRALAGQPRVRVVDPAPEVTDPERAVFVAPLPEQSGQVRPPPDDGLATPAGAATPSGQ